MEPNQHLSDDEARALTAFLSSLKKSSAAAPAAKAAP
jgi:cytochrome c1